MSPPYILKMAFNYQILLEGIAIVSEPRYTTNAAFLLELCPECQSSIDCVG